jgi:hypothetical protein
VRWAARLLVAVVIATLVLAGAAAVAAEVSACWVEQRQDLITGRPQSVTVCRIDGAIVEYGTVIEVPAVLYPDVGTAAGVQCWFWTSRVTQWVIILRNADGSAILGWDPDGVPGGPLVVDTFAPVCTSEPIVVDPDVLVAWQVVRSYVQNRPEPVLDPPPPNGLAGLETRLGVAAPEPLTVRLVSPGTGRPLDVEAWVGAVRVDWGDGTVETYPLALVPHLTGTEDGAAVHVYEVKTCATGGDRCHPSLAAYPIEVSYEWAVRWRVDGGPWQILAVPAATTAIDYPVGEVVGTVTGGS